MPTPEESTTVVNASTVRMSSLFIGENKRTKNT